MTAPNYQHGYSYSWVPIPPLLPLCRWTTLADTYRIGPTWHPSVLIEYLQGCIVNLDYFVSLKITSARTLCREKHGCTKRIKIT